MTWGRLARVSAGAGVDWVCRRVGVLGVARGAWRVWRMLGTRHTVALFRLAGVKYAVRGSERPARVESAPMSPEVRRILEDYSIIAPQTPDDRVVFDWRVTGI